MTVHVPDAPRAAVAEEISHLRGRIKTLEASEASFVRAIHSSVGKYAS
jgi:hypothetical protein